MDGDCRLEAEDGVGGQIINQDPVWAKEHGLAHLLCYIFILLVLFTYLWTGCSCLFASLWSATRRNILCINL